MTPTEFYAKGLATIQADLEGGKYITSPQINFNLLDADLEKLRLATMQFIHEQAAEGAGGG